MALFKITRGAEANLPTTYHDGYAYFCTDTGSFYIDYKEKESDPDTAIKRRKISSGEADKLISSIDAGAANIPVYFVDGLPVATTYQLNATVPSDAKFTDTNTTYSIKEGSTNGKITLVPSSGDEISAKVKGLGSAAYTNSNDYDESGAAADALSDANAYTDEAIKNFTTSNTVDSKISTHNTSAQAHNDIRESITNLTNKTKDLKSAAYQEASAFESSGAAAKALSDAQNYTDEKLAEAKTHTNTEIQKLDKADTAQIGKYVSAVSQADGIITVSRADLPDYSDIYYDKNAGENLAEALDEIDSKVQDHTTDITSNPHNITKATIGLDKVSNTADKDKIVAQATKDGGGNVITTTYETKSDAADKLSSANSYTDEKVAGLISSTAVDTKISTHNSSDTAHTDIRTLITTLSTKVNNFLDVNDSTADELSEILQMINNNKGTLESLTNSKVNVSDIINNLTSTDTNKPLSAAQGKALKGLIDSLNSGKLDTSALTTHANSSLHITADERTKWNNASATASSAHTLASAAVPNTYTINGKPMSGTGLTIDLDFSPSDHNHDDEYYSKVDGEELSTKVETLETNFSNVATTANNAVPNTRKVNNKTLSSDITLTYSDVGAAPATHSHDEYVNQNAFKTIKVNNTDIVADTSTDTLTLTAGSNITLTPDATNDKITIAATDTNTTYTFASGDSNGQIKVTPSGGTAQNVAVKGLGSAAYTDSTSYYSKANGENLNTTVSSHISSKTNPHEVTKAQVGLSNVTNDAQVKRSEMGAANGVATLGSDSKVPTAQLPSNVVYSESGKIPETLLPSYVDDVLEYASKANFPVTGDTGKIYVAKDTNLTYRWGGSAYVEISPSIALGETESTAYRGDRGKIAYDHSQTSGVHITSTERTKWDNAATELAGVKTTLESKQDGITGGASTITSSNLTANRALISNSSGKVAVSAVTSTELGYLDGVTSSIQTQLNNKVSSSALSDYYTKSAIDSMVFITTDDIDTICGTSIVVATIHDEDDDVLF